ncbi:OmpP1/FadL family transporter [Moraxella pluranimalium]|uniref:Uncharacterized protein n=1 Tax=Moraxella pluranimalium TaxID=470453 RepID=A0A1T0CSG8_9GAMM|nr:hypothetical protein [Moraxella pluranimalium]OOS25111.1 hypothetical protein B0680_03140 [Moraxella pluranimalium]
MSVSFGYKSLTLAVVAGLAATTAQAAGLDRSGQDVTAFLQDGTYAEFVYTYIDADVSGHDNGVTAGAATNNYVQGKATGDGAEAYDFFRFGVKADVNDRFSVGVLYDEPFGAAVQYMGDNNFVTDANSATVAGVNLISSQLANSALPDNVKQKVGQIAAGITTPQQAQAVAAMLKNPQQLAGLMGAAAAQMTPAQLAAIQAAATSAANGLEAVAANATALDGEGTNVEIRTNNVTALVGAKFGEKRNFQVYGGPAAQRLNGEVHLRGIAYQAASGYDAKISTDTSVGWVAGVAYSKPEIALKAALTYRSEIEHETSIAEVFPNVALRGLNPATTKDFKVTLPESYNLDFQTGVNPTTLLTAKVRYVPWSNFDIKPTTYTALSGLPIISYSDDQWAAEVGLGKKLNDKLAVSGTVGYDSGAGNPASTLGPIEGYYSVGLGAKYNVTPEWSVSVGGKYLKFGDATANLPNGMTAGEFSDNDGYIAGVKLAYQAK